MSWLLAPILLGGGTQGISDILGAPQSIFNTITGTSNTRQKGQGEGQGQGQGQGQGLGSDSTMLIIAGISVVALIILIKK